METRHPNIEDHINLGNWTIEELDRTLSGSVRIKEIGGRIDLLSNKFLGTAYKESTLIGDRNNPEVFVINLEGVDCLTFIEYIEAMRRSGSFAEFTENLKRVRYRMGMVSFESRNHFFTDWREYSGGLIEDVTNLIGGQRTMSVMKRLNIKMDGTYIIPEIHATDREIRYIPASAVDDLIINGLETGDYAGIFSDEEGLDVSHTGIIIKTGNGIYLRHASSQTTFRKVIDEDFNGYIIKKRGIIVLRPRQT